MIFVVADKTKLIFKNRKNDHFGSIFDQNFNFEDQLLKNFQINVVLMY